MKWNTPTTEFELRLMVYILTALMWFMAVVLIGAFIFIGVYEWHNSGAGIGLIAFAAACKVFHLMAVDWMKFLRGRWHDV